MGIERTRELDEGRKRTIAKIQKKKNVRRKRRKADNARLRDKGLKFNKTDNCYSSNCHE